jgi:hypothetical protein
VGKTVPDREGCEGVAVEEAGSAEDRSKPKKPAAINGECREQTRRYAMLCRIGLCLAVVDQRDPIPAAYPEPPIVVFSYGGNIAGGWVVILVERQKATVLKTEQSMGCPDQHLTVSGSQKAAYVRL